MEESYEALKANMREPVVLQNRLFWESQLRGTRHILPLAGRELAVVFYAGRPEAPAAKNEGVPFIRERY